MSRSIPARLGLMGSIPTIAGRQGRFPTIPGAVPVPEAMPTGGRFASRCRLAVSRCDAGRQPLRTDTAGHAMLA